MACHPAAQAAQGAYRSQKTTIYNDYLPNRVIPIFLSVIQLQNWPNFGMMRPQ
jgi:hypothetical protein